MEIMWALHSSEATSTPSPASWFPSSGPQGERPSEAATGPARPWEPPRPSQLSHSAVHYLLFQVPLLPEWLRSRPQPRTGDTSFFGQVWPRSGRGRGRKIKPQRRTTWLSVLPEPWHLLPCQAFLLTSSRAGRPARWEAPVTLSPTGLLGGTLGPALSFAASPGSSPVSLRSTRSPRTARGPCGQASPRPRPRPPRPPRAAPRPRQPAAGRGLRRRAGLPPRVRAPTSVLAAPPPAAASPLKRRATHRPGFPQRGVWAAFAALEEPRPECAPPNRPATRQRLGPAHRPRPPGRAWFLPPPPTKGDPEGRQGSRGGGSRLCTLLCITETAIRTVWRRSFMLKVCVLWWPSLFSLPFLLSSSLTVLPFWAFMWARLPSTLLAVACTCTFVFAQPKLCEFWKKRVCIYFLNALLNKI